MIGCCKFVCIKENKQIISVDKYTYSVKIHYCINCGSIKSTSSIRKIK